jgi:hypothetical protein
LAPTLIVLFIVGFIALVIVAIVFGAKAKKRRQMALAAWAQSKGFHYTPDEVSTIENRFGNFGCFTRGDNRYGYNVMRGEVHGRPTWAFDYHYETHSRDSKGNRTTTHHHFSAVVVDSRLALRPLRIRTEGFFDKMKGAFGFDDIDFESAEFSRKFWVTAPDKRWAYTVISQRTMEFLLESPRFKVEMEGPWVLVYRSTRFQSPVFEQAFAVAHGILERLPKDVVEDLRR